MKSPDASISRAKRTRPAQTAAAILLLGVSAARAQLPNTLHHTLLSPHAQPQSVVNFGESVATNGTVDIVGAPFSDTLVMDAGQVFVFDAATGTLLHTLNNPAPALDDEFGYSVAVSGNLIAVGVLKDDSPNPTPANGDKFGAAVGISGAVGILGAPNDDTVLLDKGAAHVYGLERPEIAISQPVATNIVDGGTKNYGNVRIGEPVSFVFTLRNTGTSDLSGISLTKNGAHAADFNILASPPALVGPGGSTSFTVQFNPIASGTRTAALHIASNDFDENPFDINLTAQAYSVTEDFDNDGMNDWAEFQLAAQGFDWRLSQPALVSGFYAGANSAGLFTQSQLQAVSVTPLLGKDPGTGQFKLVLGFEKSTDLTNFTPFPMTAPQTAINAQGKLEFLFPAPANAAFFKVQQN